MDQARPVLILQYDADNGPAHFADVLTAHDVPMQLLRIDQGASVPDLTDVADVADNWAGLCLMGGPMSVNDDLPWIAPVLALIRAAVAADVPVLGHCLGGQLLAHALGARIGASPAPEVGWAGATAEVNEAARHWCGDLDEVVVFHWHFESFALPDGALRVLTNRHCPNQAFAIGPHFASQAHLEVTRAVVEAWSDKDRLMLDSAARDGARHDSIEDYAGMRAGIVTQLPRMRVLTERIYTRWLAGVLERDLRVARAA